LIAGLRAAVELGGKSAGRRGCGWTPSWSWSRCPAAGRSSTQPCKPLAQEAARLINKLGSVRLTWIPRERNKRADRLANLAMDAQAAR